jgi:hypothetical protein
MLLAFLKELMMKSSSVIYFNWFRLFGLSALINLAFLISLWNVVCTMMYTYILCVIISPLVQRMCMSVCVIKSRLSHFLVLCGMRCDVHLFCVCEYMSKCYT